MRIAKKPRKTNRCIARCPTELQDAKTVWAWKCLHETRHPDLEMLFHVPNEGRRSPRAGADLKASGMVRGIPDWFLDVERHGFKGLRIEQKRLKGGRLQVEQGEWLDRYTKRGYMACVCVGAAAVIETLADYLGIDKRT